jgi:DNA-directed RNA polymerase II subunit RPB2
MNDETIWKIIETHFKDNYQSLVRHHIESYEHFFSHDIFKIFKEKNPLVIGTNYDRSKDEFMHECKLYFGGKNGDAIYFGKPCIYDNDNFHYMYPNEARLRNMTYGMTIHYDVDIEFTIHIDSNTGKPYKTQVSDNTGFKTKTDDEVEQTILKFKSGGGPKKAQKNNNMPEVLLEQVLKMKEEKSNENVIKKTLKLERMYLGRFPIMLQSKYCILQGLPRDTRFSYGECLNDPGGYFIIEGKEKTVVCQEKFADNMLYIRKQNDDSKYSHSAEIRSISENVSKPQRTLSVAIVNSTSSYKNKQIVVNIPNVRSEIPLFIVFRALGVISDKDIIHHCLLDLDVNENMIQYFEPSVYDGSTTFTQVAALKYIGSFTKYKSIEHILELLCDYFLPHVGENNFKQKALFLGNMTYKLLRVYTNQDEPTDRDSFKYKRIELVGSLLYDLFREYYNIQLKTIHLEFEKRITLNKALYENDLISLVNQFYSPIFRERVLEKGFRDGFKGNWGALAHTKRIGVLQELNILSQSSKLSHLRKTNLPLDASVKVVGPRVLHGSQWGFFDPIDTPDGGNIGLHKHLSLSTYVTRKISREPIINWVLNNTKIESIENTTLNNLYHFIKVFVNGFWLGIVREPNDFVNKVKIYRRNGLLPTYLSISFEIKSKTIYLFCDEGRVTRPMFYKDNNEISFEKPKILDSINKNEFHWNDLVSGFNKKTLDNYDPSNYAVYSPKELYGLDEENINKLQQFNDKKAIIDYVDNNESDNSLIALKYEDFLKNPEKYTHLEIHESLILGVMCNLIPFPENNPATRNSFSCGQSKQAASLYNTNYQMRMDKSAVVLNNGQIPIIKTRYMQYINNEENVYGENAIVAIMTYTSYNVEDAVLINEGALQRGLFRTTYFTTYETHEESTNTGDETHKKTFLNIENDKTVLGLKIGYDYSQLDEYGIIKEGTTVNDKTILIGSATSSSNMEHKRDASKSTKKGQLGVVDKSYITEGEEGTRIAKVRVREVRIPNIGDKFASRAGQKGTVGLVVPECDMPFTKKGIRPDIIINPHALPSRMTIGQLVETIIGKASCMYGGFSDCTAFNNNGSKIDVFGKMLNKVGFHSSGNDILYNGMDGSQIESEIFMGPTYYMRLKHMVKDKINFRSLGPRNVMTRQAVSGRANDGGLRIGEMERDGVISHGAAAFLQDSMMERGDKFKVAVCNKTGFMAIYNENKNLFFSPIADGPIKFSGSLETDDMRLNVVTRFGRDFSIIHVPYSFKLLLQELQTMNVQMRLITDSNIEHIENMKFSDNIFKLSNITPSDNTTEDFRKVRSEIYYKLRKGDDKKIPKTPVIEAYTPVDDDENVEDTPVVPNNLLDDSPATIDSVQYAPDDPNFDIDKFISDYEPSADSSPMYNPFAQQDSPQPNLDILNDNSSTNLDSHAFKQGMKVNFRGDFKEKRIWNIKKVGPKFITIQTEDDVGLSETDKIKIVTPIDISEISDLPLNEPYTDPISPISDLKETPNQNGGGDKQPSINFAPVFNMMQPSVPPLQQFAGEPVKIPVNTITGGDSSNEIINKPSENTGGNRTADLIDSNIKVNKIG